VLFRSENYPHSPQTAATNGLHTQVTEGHDAWHYPLRLITAPGSTLTLQLWYRPDRLDHGTAGQIIQRVAWFAQTMAADLLQPVGEITSSTACWRDHELLVQAAQPSTRPSGRKLIAESEKAGRRQP